MVRRAEEYHTLSSIALLQERFRQLQKMKELRQERELMRTLSESERCTSITTSTTPAVRRSASSPPSAPPPPPQHCQLALSLWPESQTKHAESQRAMKSAAAATAPAYHCDNDIDTSLRL